MNESTRSRARLPEFSFGDVSVFSPAELRRLDASNLRVPPSSVILQSKASQRSPLVHDDVEAQAVSQQGFRGNGSKLPYLDEIQGSFGGYDLSGVRTFVAPDTCKALGAQAYAVGERVAFAGPPSLHTSAHEATHVIQQRAGVHLTGGVGRAGDVYERHANDVADAVVAGGSAEALLARLSPNPTRTGQSDHAAAVQLGPKSLAVKKAVKLLSAILRQGGDWLVDGIISRLDDEAAAGFRRHAGRIADGLDEIAAVPDLATRVVREKLYYYMINELQLGSGTALVIADAVDWALWFLL